MLPAHMRERVEEPRHLVRDVIGGYVIGRIRGTHQLTDHADGRGSPTYSLYPTGVSGVTAKPRAARNFGASCAQVSDRVWIPRSYIRAL